MARIPDGWVITPDVKYEDGSISIDLIGRELVMCKHCKLWDKEQFRDGINGFCPNTGCVQLQDYYCADGERRDDDAAD